VRSGGCLAGEFTPAPFACNPVKNVVVNLNPEPFDWYGRWPGAPKG
jgi:hypothetical protein